jgi:hypothetical protein
MDTGEREEPLNQSQKQEKEISLRAVENRKSRKIFGPRTEDVTGVRKKLRYEDLHGFYSTSVINSAIESRR